MQDACLEKVRFKGGRPENDVIQEGRRHGHDKAQSTLRYDCFKSGYARIGEVDHTTKNLREANRHRLVAKEDGARPKEAELKGEISANLSNVGRWFP